MGEFPIQPVLDFLGQAPPFEVLTRDELIRAGSNIEIAYYPRLKVILRRGDEPPAHLYIIKSGSVSISISDEDGSAIPVDLRGEGDYFGAASLLEGKKALFDVTAEQDVIAYLLPAAVFLELAAGNAHFKRFFTDSLAHNIRAVRGAPSTPLMPCAKAGPGLEAYLMGQQVADLMTRQVLVCPPEASVSQAAQIMSQRRVGSIVVAQPGGAALGIITDTDLRNRVLARGLTGELEVRKAMTKEPRTIHATAFAFDALLEMGRHGVRHLLVINGGGLAGIISEHDIQLAAGASPLGVMRDLDKVASVEELAALGVEIRRVLKALLDQTRSVTRMMEWITEMNDRATIKLISLAEAEMIATGWGEPPAAYAWLAMGSEGRREQTISTDQDNGLVYADPAPPEQELVKAWLHEFGGKVVAGLERYGFPLCTGGIMASNEQWSLSLSQWQEQVAAWLANPSGENLLKAGVFFDFRALYGDPGLARDLRQTIKRGVGEKRHFLRFLAKRALDNRPPLGLLRQLVMEKQGEHAATINIKLKGLAPIVDAARIMALDADLSVSNTLARLAGCQEAGLLDAALHADLREAYLFMTLLRMRHQFEKQAEGDKPDNFVAPELMNNLERKMLKESFRAVNRLQDRLAWHYQTHLILET